MLHIPKEEDHRSLKVWKIPLLTNNDVMPDPFEVVYLDMIGSWTVNIKLAG